jgi:tetratricopeptide (TPR) repeat protein
MASDYGNLGNVLQARGDLDGAEQMHRKSLEIEEQLGHLEGMASDYGNLGNVLQARGDPDGAEQMYRKALLTAQQLGASQLITLAESRLSTLHMPPSKTANDV